MRQGRKGRDSVMNPRIGHAVLFSWLAAAGVFASENASPYASDGAEHPAVRSENAFLVLVDGLRWQEVFGGAEDALLSKDLGGINEKAVANVRKEYWRETPEARREVLMPFFWTKVATEGQLIGNQTKGCVARVSNGKNFSYPGYSEMLVGYADPRIDSNDKKPNPNVTVLEWLNRKPRFAGRVAAIGSWAVVPWIVNRERCGFFVVGADEPITQGTISPEQALLNRLKKDIPGRFSPDPYDAVTYYSAVEYIKQNQPRVFYLTFGETDEWGHSRKYDEYLKAARRTDQFIRELWEMLQATPQYAGKTTLIVACDHGRGDGKEWTDHGKDVKAAENIWIAVLGPDTPALGERGAESPGSSAGAAERVTGEPVIQAQIAATLAAALGEDYAAAEPKAARAIARAIEPAGR